MDEEWKWIKGFEGQYQISNYGRVKSLAKIFMDCLKTAALKKMILN